MFKIREVEKVCYSSTCHCTFAIYYDSDGREKFAACTENLSIKCGDKIEIYTDDFVYYRGFNEMILKVI